MTKKKTAFRNSHAIYEKPLLAQSLKCTAGERLHDLQIISSYMERKSKYKNSEPVSSSFFLQEKV
jgi:hypothetical protein